MNPPTANQSSAQTINGNPARRLHRILLRMLAFTAPDEQLWHAWGRGFQLPDKDFHRILRGIALGSILPLQSTTLIKNAKGARADKLLSWTDPVNSLFNQRNLEAHAAGLIRPLNGAYLNLLDICADEIDQLVLPHEIDGIPAILSQIRELFSVVNDSSLPEQVREYVIHHLLMIEQALLDTVIQGPTAITGMFEEAIVGGAVLHREEIREHMETPVIKKYLAIVGAVCLTIKTFRESLGLVTDATRLLESASNVSALASDSELNIDALAGNQTSSD